MKVIFLRRRFAVFATVVVLALIVVFLWTYNTLEETQSTTSLPPAPKQKPSSRRDRLTSAMENSTEKYVWCDHRQWPKRRQFTKEPQDWQFVADHNITVFSAFVDWRPAVGGPTLRVIATGLQTQFNKVGDVFCDIWYNDVDVPVSVGPATYELIYPSIMFAEMWVAHFILCPLPHGVDVPFAVSISAAPCTAPASNTLMVLNTTPQHINNESFAVCLSPIYNEFKDWEMIVEMIELHKILGVSEIAIYNFSLSPNALKAINRYMTDPDEHITVVEWHFPVRTILTNFWDQHAALNDCLYRMATRHRFVAVYDIDEVCVPRRHDTWMQMMRELYTPTRGAYLCQHAYFRRNKTGEQPYLVTQQSLWRTDKVTPPGKIRCKTIYEAARTNKVDIHSSYKLQPGYEEHIVEPTDAILHHYRDSPMETFVKKPNDFTFIEDRYIWKYKDALIRTLKKRVHSIDEKKYA